MELMNIELVVFLDHKVESLFILTTR